MLFVFFSTFLKINTSKVIRDSFLDPHHFAPPMINCYRRRSRSKLDANEEREEASSEFVEHGIVSPLAVHRTPRILAPVSAALAWPHPVPRARKTRASPILRTGFTHLSFPTLLRHVRTAVRCAALPRFRDGCAGARRTYIHSGARANTPMPRQYAFDTHRGQRDC